MLDFTDLTWRTRGPGSGTVSAPAGRVAPGGGSDRDRRTNEGSALSQAARTPFDVTIEKTNKVLKDIEES
jgi:hypothetical protein